jgi:hypothetical protein
MTGEQVWWVAAPGAVPGTCAASPVTRFACDPGGSVNGFMAWLSATLWSVISV